MPAVLAYIFTRASGAFVQRRRSGPADNVRISSIAGNRSGSHRRDVALGREVDWPDCSLVSTFAALVALLTILARQTAVAK